MTELQRDKKVWPCIIGSQSVRIEKRVRRRKERHRQNAAIQKDVLPQVHLPTFD